MKLQGKHHRRVMGFVAWILGFGLTTFAHAEVQKSVRIQAGWNLMAAPSNAEHQCAWTGLGLTLWATARRSEGGPGAGEIERSEEVSCGPESLDPKAPEPSDEARVVWVFARSDLELPMAASVAAALVPAGWNMLTVPEKTVYADPNILRVSRWDAQAQRYQGVRLGDALKAGYGYLAFLQEAGAPFQDDCLGSKWTLETVRTVIETCPFSGPASNGPAPRPSDPALPTYIVLESATEDAAARGAMHDRGSIAPDFKSSAHFTVTQTASGAWNIIENQPPGAQLPPLLRIHIDEPSQGSDASLSEINTELPQKGAVLRVAELIAELSERFSPIEGVVWDERGSGAWMPLIDALQRRFFGPGVAARPPTELGAFEAPAAVSPRGLLVALPKVALVTHDDRTWAHLVHVARPGRSQNFEVAYRRSKKAAQDRSFETTKTLAAPGDGWAITDLAIAARGDKVSVAWTQTQTGPKTQPKQSLVRVAESHDRGAHFFAPRTVRKNDAWKRGLSLGYDRFGHLHLVWGEAHKAYYLKDLTKEPENVFDVVVREKNDLVVSYALAHQNPLCHKPVAPCGCIEWSQEAYSYALETNPKTGEAFGPYRTRTEEAFVYNPSLTIDDDAVSIIAHQDRMWDNRAVPNPDWPLEKNMTPDEAGGTCPKPGTRIAQAGFQDIWQKRAHDLEPQRHLEETPGTNPSGPQEGAGSDTPGNKTHHQYLYDGTWHEEDQIRIAQRPLVEDAWSEPSTGKRDVPVWPMREGLLEWKTAEVPVEEGFKVGAFQNGVRQDWRHTVVAPLQSPLHEGRHDAPKLAVKKQGHLVAVYSDGPSSNAHLPGQNPIFVTQSLDGGITWSRGTQVAHGYLPDAAATQDGEVGLLVYHLGALGHATPPAPKIDMLRTRDLQVWERDTLNLYPPTPIHRTHHENGAHHPDLFDDPIGVPALSGHQALFVATWVRSEIDPQPGTRIVTTRAARAPETRRYEITHTGPLTVGQSTQFTITAVNAYDMRVHDDGKVHLGVASRGQGGISQRSPHAGINQGSPHVGTNQGSPHAGTNQGSPHEGTSPLRPGREAVDQAVPDLSPLGQVRPKGGPIDQALTHGETEDPAFRSENAANPTFSSENAANPTFSSENAANPTFRSENAAIPTFRSENTQALALVEGRSPPATVQLQNGQATFVRLTTETDTTLLVQSEENPTGRASATTLLAYASGAAGNYQRALEARDRMMRTVVDEATQQTWVFQVEYAPEASPQPGDASASLTSSFAEPGMVSDAKYLANFERVWVYTQGIAVAQLSKQQDTVSQAAAQGMARYLCAHAEKGHHEGRTVILGWPFSWNTAGDNWKDRRLVTGANAWAIHGLGVFVASEAFDSLSDKEQRAIRGCYEEAIRGLLVHRRRLVAPGTDQTVSLVTAGWTARGLTVAENPSALFTEEEESVQWGYYSVLDAIGYDAFTEDRAPEVARFRHTPGAPPTKLAPRVLTEQDHQRLKTRVLASNVVTEHNLDVLSVLNHALRHQEKIGLQDFAELEVFRDELRDGIFVLLWDDQEYTQDLAYTLRQTGPDDPRRPALEEALEAQDLGRIVTGGHFSGTGENLHFSASNHVAIDNCSWLSLSVDHGLLPERPEYIERLARCLRYTELQFVKPLPFAGRTYLGAHYFQNTFRDPYISPSALQESSYHLEATTGLILGLARFARAYPEHPDALYFADQTRALWNGVQLFVKDHGFRYSSQRIQDLSTLLASSTAAIWFIDVYRELNQDWAGLRGIAGTERVFDPGRSAASSLAHKDVVSLGLFGGHEAFVGFQSQNGAIWVDTKALQSDGSVGAIYPEAQGTFGPGVRATKPGTVLANAIKKGAASLDEFSPGTSAATSQLLAAGTALASIVALSTGQVETWTTLIHLNQAPNVHTEPWTFVGTVPEDEVTFLGLFFKDEALIRHTRIQQSHVQGGFATSTVEFEADAIYGLVKEVYGPSEGMLKDLYRLGLPTGEPISVYRLDTELSPEAIVGAVLDQQVPWLKPSTDPAPNETDFTADLFRELKALALTPDFRQVDLAELIHTLENQAPTPEPHDTQTIIPESPLGTAWLDQVPEAFRASVYYWLVLLPQYVAPQSSGPPDNSKTPTPGPAAGGVGPGDDTMELRGQRIRWVDPAPQLITEGKLTFAPTDGIVVDAFDAELRFAESQRQNLGPSGVEQRLDGIEVPKSAKMPRGVTEMPIKKIYRSFPIGSPVPGAQTSLLSTAVSNLVDEGFDLRHPLRIYVLPGGQLAVHPDDHHTVGAMNLLGETDVPVRFVLPPYERGGSVPRSNARLGTNTGISAHALERALLGIHQSTLLPHPGDWDYIRRHRGFYENIEPFDSDLWTHATSESGKDQAGFFSTRSVNRIDWTPVPKLEIYIVRPEGGIDLNRALGYDFGRDEIVLPHVHAKNVLGAFSTQSPGKGVLTINPDADGPLPEPYGLATALEQIDLYQLQMGTIPQFRLAPVVAKLQAGEMFAPPLLIVRKEDGSQGLLSSHVELQALKEVGMRTMPAAIIHWKTLTHTDRQTLIKHYGVLQDGTVTLPIPVPGESDALELVRMKAQLFLSPSTQPTMVTLSGELLHETPPAFPPAVKAIVIDDFRGQNQPLPRILPKNASSGAKHAAVLQNELEKQAAITKTRLGTVVGIDIGPTDQATPSMVLAAIRTAIREAQRVQSSDESPVGVISLSPNLGYTVESQFPHADRDTMSALNQEIQDQLTEVLNEAARAEILVFSGSGPGAHLSEQVLEAGRAQPLFFHVGGLQSGTVDPEAAPLGSRSAEADFMAPGLAPQSIEGATVVDNGPHVPIGFAAATALMGKMAALGETVSRGKEPIDLPEIIRSTLKKSTYDPKTPDHLSPVDVYALTNRVVGADQNIEQAKREKEANRNFTGEYNVVLEADHAAVIKHTPDGKEQTVSSIKDIVAEDDDDIVLYAKNGAQIDVVSGRVWNNGLASKDIRLSPAGVQFFGGPALHAAGAHVRFLEHDANQLGKGFLSDGTYVTTDAIFAPDYEEVMAHKDALLPLVRKEGVRRRVDNKWVSDSSEYPLGVAEVDASTIYRTEWVDANSPTHPGGQSLKAHMSALAQHGFNLNQPIHVFYERGKPFVFEHDRALLAAMVLLGEMRVPVRMIVDPKFWALSPEKQIQFSPESPYGVSDVALTLGRKGATQAKYVADPRDPNEVFEQGIQADGHDTNLWKHLWNTGAHSAWLSGFFRARFNEPEIIYDSRYLNQSITYYLVRQQDGLDLQSATGINTKKTAVSSVAGRNVLAAVTQPRVSGPLHWIINPNAVDPLPSVAAWATKEEFFLLSRLAIDPYDRGEVAQLRDAVSDDHIALAPLVVLENKAGAAILLEGRSRAAVTRSLGGNAMPALILQWELLSPEQQTALVSDYPQVSGIGPMKSDTAPELPKFLNAPKFSDPPIGNNVYVRFDEGLINHNPKKPNYDGIVLLSAHDGELFRSGMESGKFFGDFSTVLDALGKTPGLFSVHVISHRRQYEPVDLSMMLPEGTQNYTFLKKKHGKNAIPRMAPGWSRQIGYIPLTEEPVRMSNTATFTPKTVSIPIQLKPFRVGATNTLHGLEVTFSYQEAGYTVYDAELYLAKVDPLKFEKGPEDFVYFPLDTGPTAKLRRFNLLLDGPDANPSARDGLSPRAFLQSFGQPEEATKELWMSIRTLGEPRFKRTSRWSSDDDRGSAREGQPIKVDVETFTMRP